MFGNPQSAACVCVLSREGHYPSPIMPLFFILYKADLPTHEFHQKRSPTIHPYSYTFYEDKHIKTKYYVIMGKWFKNMNNEYCHITIIVDEKQECVRKG